MKRAILLAALAIWTLPIQAAGQVLRSVDDQSFAAFTDRHGAHLDVRVDKSSELTPALKIYTGRLNQKSFSYNALGIVKLSQQRALIPFEQLSPVFQKSYIEKMWPRDRLKNGHWEHRVTYRGHETLWTIAAIFTGSGQNYRAILRASGRRSDKIGQGVRLRIPESLLRPILRSGSPIDIGEPTEPVFAGQTQLVETTQIENADPAPTVSPPANETEEAPAAPPQEEPEDETAQDPVDDERERARRQAVARELAALEASRRDLRYGNDAKGRYAEYRLRAGEAIYSSVVVRFCGLIRADDVNRIAGEIIERNNIRDETDLPIGARIRIPYDYLEPEYRAEDDPEYIAYVRNIEDVASMSTQVVSRNLEGVHIILDAGHGGRDPGALFGWVWEDDFVYDIVCRIKKRLEVETAATVYATVLDPTVKHKVQNVSRFTRDHDEVLTTNPAYSLNSARVTTDGVNLRWIYANHRFHKLKAEGVKPENILFASIHADSLHRSIRGSMVYIPDARIVPGKVRASGKFRRFREYSGNSFSVSRKERLRAQALSNSFAKNFIGQLRGRDVAVHRQKPIRSVIYRNPTRPFVPAVLKYNRTPTRCLIEVCNLNNSEDRALLRDYRFRQRIADAFVEAVYQTYGVPSGGAVSYISDSASREPNEP